MAAVSSSATKVRQEFANFLDDARQRPQYIKRRSYQYIVLPVETFEALVPSGIELKTINDEDGSYFTENKQFPDVIGFGSSKDEAISSFKEGLLSYSYEYYDQFLYYSVAPGRKEQAPTVLQLISHYERFGSIDKMVKVA